MSSNENARKHSHYFKSVAGLTHIDVYRVLQLFNVSDPCIQHAVKKLLVAGGRGAGKDITRDIKEAIDSLVRWQEMRQEEVDAIQPVAPLPPMPAPPVQPKPPLGPRPTFPDDVCTCGHIHVNHSGHPLMCNDDSCACMKFVFDESHPENVTGRPGAQ